MGNSTGLSGGQFPLTEPNGIQKSLKRQPLPKQKPNLPLSISLFSSLGSLLEYITITDCSDVIRSLILHLEASILIDYSTLHLPHLHLLSSPMARTRQNRRTQNPPQPQRRITRNQSSLKTKPMTQEEGPFIELSSDTSISPTTSQTPTVQEASSLHTLAQAIGALTPSPIEVMGCLRWLSGSTMEEMGGRFGFCQSGC
ncbi:hypothetical protein L6452_36149 [Arctium lappa]|uniref:Uncharacterized protein n=1 Tax=Arctium lappa TaxID=4217 RepID=A0ACB8Y8H3_ARCLA|nr:hypothetical protein L6452_36149 [Arctium lappa]